MIQGPSALSRAIAVLRTSISGAATDTIRNARRRAGALTSDRAGTPGIATHVATLATRLATVDPADPARRKKALRMFVEAALLDEFGGELILSQEFQSIVDRTLSALDAETALATTLDKAIGELGLT